MTQLCRKLMGLGNTDRNSATARYMHRFPRVAMVSGGSGEHTACGYLLISPVVSFP